MDPLAALPSERPPQLMSATELRSYIAQLEDAARACCAELESRTTRLDVLPDENPQEKSSSATAVQRAQNPRAAVAYSSASKGLREPMQRVGEAAGKRVGEAAAAAEGGERGGRRAGP